MNISMDDLTGGETCNKKADDNLRQVAQLLGNVAKIRSDGYEVVVELKLALPLAYSVAGLESASTLSRSTIYEDIKSGALIARRAGDRRTVVTLIDALAWLQALPMVRARERREKRRAEDA